MEKQLKLMHYLNIIGPLALVIAAYLSAPWLKSLETLDNAPLPPDNPRSAFMVQTAADLASHLGIPPPRLSITQDRSAPFTIRVMGNPAEISLSEEMFSPHVYTDGQVRAILAHELAHAVRWDSYRFYTVIDLLHRAMEDEADCQAARLVGAAAMEDLFTAYRSRTDARTLISDDQHSTIEDRIATVRRCGQVQT